MKPRAASEVTASARIPARFASLRARFSAAFARLRSDQRRVDAPLAEPHRESSSEFRSRARLRIGGGSRSSRLLFDPVNYRVDMPPHLGFVDQLTPVGLVDSHPNVRFELLEEWIRRALLHANVVPGCGKLARRHRRRPKVTRNSSSSACVISASTISLADARRARMPPRRSCRSRSARRSIAAGVRRIVIGCLAG